MKIRSNQPNVTNFRKYQNSSQPSNLNFSKHLNPSTNTKSIEPTNHSYFVNYSSLPQKTRIEDRKPLNLSYYKANIMANLRDEKAKSSTIQNTDYKTWASNSYTKSDRSSSIIPPDNKKTNSIKPNIEYDQSNVSSYLRPTSYHQQFNTKTEKSKFQADYKPTEFTKINSETESKLSLPVDEKNINSIIASCNDYSTEGISSFANNQKHANDHIPTKFRPSAMIKETPVNNSISSTEKENESQEIVISNYRKFAQNRNLQTQVSIELSDITSFNRDRTNDSIKTNKFNYEEEVNNIINSSSQMNTEMNLETSNRFTSDNEDIDSLLDIPIKKAPINQAPILLKDENDEALNIQAKLAKFRQTISLVKKTEEEYIEWFPQDKIDLPKNKSEETLKENNNEMLSEPSLIFADQEDEN